MHLTMDSPFINLGPFSVRTFMALIAAAALIGLAAVTATAYRRGERHPLRWFDAGLGGVLGGVIGARLFHVLLNWAYFADHSGEIINLRAGGLNWHGALYGGLLGLWLAARWRGVPFRHLSDVLALVWPVGVMAGWAGCWASACGYGAEVWTLADFPTWAVSERPDVYGIAAPRYNVQLFGVWFGAALLVMSILLAVSGRLHGCRLWLLLALSGAGMFVLDFFRGDGTASFLPNLTWDHILDLSVIAFSVVAVVGMALYSRVASRDPAVRGVVSAESEK